MTSNSLLIQKVANYIQANNLVTSENPIIKKTIIIGFSGGPDSLFLLYAFAALQTQFNISLIAAHLDHEWRTDSIKDLEFCKTIAKKLAVPFVHEKASNITLKKQPNGSLEEQGRLLRRTYFEQVQHEYNADTIALGHHNNDQQETFFIRLVRGAGVRGLAGIKPHDGNYIHPLLCCTKQEIINELEAHSIHYLVDPTNRDNQFLRNRIRNTVIPALNTCDKRFEQSLNRTMTRLSEADTFITNYTSQEFAIIFNKKSIDYKKLLTYHPYIQKQLLLTWFITSDINFTPSNALFNEVLRFLTNTKSQQHILYQSWCITKNSRRATSTFCS